MTIQIFISYLVPEITLKRQRTIDMNKLNLKVLLGMLLGLYTLAFQVSVKAENIEEGTAWVLVGNSPLLDRSSKYMFKANYSAGIKYAKKALARSQSVYTQVIAQHNLCIAYTRTDELALAKAHCELARENSIDQTYLKQIKPGLYKIVKNRKAADLPVLDKLLTQNLRKEGIKVDINHLAKAD